MGNRITDLDALQQALAKHAAIASQKARKQGSLCKTLLCFALLQTLLMMINQ